jgi:transposase
MSKPLFVRPLTDDERTAIEQGLRSTQAFTLRRCQILLASAQGDTPITIAAHLRCGDQTVRNAIHAFNTHGSAALQPGSAVAHTRPHTAFTPAAVDQLVLLLKRSPRLFGYPTSHWTLDQLAATAFAEGLTTRRVSGEAVRATLRRAGIAWKRAKHWIQSPDPAYATKKNAATG